MKKAISDRIIKIFSYISLGSFSILCLYPLILALMVSITEEKVILENGFKLIPEKFSLDTYLYIWNFSGSKILNSYGITVLVTIIGTLASLLVTSMMAYVMSQPHVKYRNVISLFSYFTVIFSAGMVPWYVVCVSILHIKNSIFALILPYLVNVFNLFLLKNYFQAIPSALVESVKIDGANEMIIYMKIIMPLSKTALLTIGFFYSLQFWNDWWLPIMLVSKSHLFTLQYYLFSMLTNVQALSNGNNGVSASAIKLPSESIKMAITIITIGPIIFLYPFIQKYFVKGLVVGAIKG